MKKRCSKILSCFVIAAALLSSVNVFAVKDEAVSNSLTEWKSSTDNSVIGINTDGKAYLQRQILLRGKRAVTMCLL